MEDPNKLKRIDYLTEEHELLNLPLIGWGRGECDNPFIRLSLH